MVEPMPFALALKRVSHEAREAGGLAALNRREREALELLAEGCSNLAIGEILGTTESAISSVINRLYGKLDIRPRRDTNQRVLAALAFWESRSL